MEVRRRTHFTKDTDDWPTAYQSGKLSGSDNVKKMNMFSIASKKVAITPKIAIKKQILCHLDAAGKFRPR